MRGLRVAGPPCLFLPAHCHQWSRLRSYHDVSHETRAAPADPLLAE